MNKLNKTQINCTNLIFADNKESWMFNFELENIRFTIILSKGFYPGLITKDWNINKKFSSKIFDESKERNNSSLSSVLQIIKNETK